MCDYLEKRPMLLGAIFASVISVMGMFAEKTLFVVCPLILVLIFALVLKKVKGEIIFAFVCVLAVALSMFFTSTKVQNLKEFDRTICDGEFVVIENPVNHGDYYNVKVETIRADTLSKGERISMSFYTENLDFGDRFKGRVTVSSLENYEQKGGFYAQNIFLSGYLQEMVEKTGEDEVLAVVGKVRNFIKEQFFDNFKISRAITAVALVTGDKSYFGDEFYSNVKRAGVAHIMVVSGMHLSIVVAIFLYLIDKFIYNRYLKSIVIFVVTIALMAVCGFTMSILRAGISYLIFSLSLILKREITSENTLGTAFLFILITNPFAVFSIGFLLSVLSTFSIIVVAVPISRFLVRKGIFNNWITKGIGTSILISLSALIFTAPVTIYYFGYISNVSLVTNLLLSFAASLALVLAVLGLMIPFLRDFLFWVCEFVLLFINKVINDFGKLPFATTDLPQYAAYIVLGVIFIILWILLACKKRKNVLKLESIRKIKSRERSKKVIWQ